jgi:hyperosmotically inducible periplasmic protein
MKTIQFLKISATIACAAFALSATAQTAQPAPSASSETMTEHLSDGTITTKVKAGLMAANNVKSEHIHVKTRNGIVWLTGTVPSADDKSNAEQVVTNVSGVQEVKNRLKVTSSAQ